MSISQLTPFVLFPFIEGARLAESAAQKRLNEEDTDGPDQTAGTRARAKARAEKRAQQDKAVAAAAAQAAAADTSASASAPAPASKVFVDTRGDGTGATASQDSVTEKSNQVQNKSTESQTGKVDGSAHAPETSIVTSTENTTAEQVQV